MQFLAKPLPAPPRLPPQPLEKPVTPIRYTAAYYKAIVDKDAAELHLPAINIAAMSMPLLHANELGEPRRMKAAGDTFETPHVKLRTHVIKEWATTDNTQGFRFEHIALQITNKSAVAIAYRVPTEVAGAERCKTKAALSHNAMVLAPGETMQRTECLFQAGATLVVKAIEIIELPPLSSSYINRIEPSLPFFDPRTSAGHVVDKSVHLCQFVPWRDIEADAQRGGSWADFIDYYARHSCSEYTYITGYRRWQTPGELPARP